MVEFPAISLKAKWGNGMDDSRRSLLRLGLCRQLALANARGRPADFRQAQLISRWRRERCILSRCDGVAATEREEEKATEREEEKRTARGA
jgi:hypothetical protein